MMVLAPLPPVGTFRAAGNDAIVKPAVAPALTVRLMVAVLCRLP